MGKKPDLLAKLRARREPKKPSPWFSKQPKECQEALLVFREEYLAGGWRKRTLAELSRGFREAYGMIGYQNGLMNFLREGKSDAESNS